MHKLRRHQGFTLIEIVMVIAIIGLLASVGVVSFSRSQGRTQARDGIISVAGMLQEARDTAISTGVPTLVYFGAPDACEDGREPLAQVVRDNDASYSPTPGDTRSDFTLEGVGCSITAYGAGEETPFPEMLPADSDLSQTAAVRVGPEPVAAGLGGVLGGLGDLLGGLLDALLGGGGGGSTPDPAPDPTPEPAATGNVPEHLGQTQNLSTTPVIEVATYGATFPVDPNLAVPAVGFTPAGVAVDVSTPTEWGSGAGAYYLTDNQLAVYAATVSPLGQVSVRAYDPVNNVWN